MRHASRVARILARAALLAVLPATLHAAPAMQDAQLGVRVAVGGLTTPTGVVFLGARDWLVIEKNTGRVRRVRNGAITGTVLDLAVNNAGDRGLLGIALHPQFGSNHYVYLFWSCRVASPPDASPWVPTATTCPAEPAYGADTGATLATPRIGNRVDRFVWDGTRLTFDRNILRLRTFQNDGAPNPPNQGDGAQAAAAFHNGGVLRFGPDRKLYVQVGDTGRRGQLQNLPSGPTLTGLGAMLPDDQFGGPRPDTSHFTGVILRLNPDGTAPTNNPFYTAGARMGGAIGANVQKIFAYGLRNAFGLAFDPVSGRLWDAEVGDDSFDELNQVTRGSNSGWIQFMGPSGRIHQYKAMEVASGTLAQLRWGPERLADTRAGAVARLFKLPGSRYSEPEFSWKHVMTPTGLGFQRTAALGTQYTGNLFVGFGSGNAPLGGPLFRFRLTGDRLGLVFSDPVLQDKVMDNLARNEMTQGQSLLFGTGFGIVSEIKPAPDGNLLVVSLTDGNLYEIYRRP